MKLDREFVLTYLNGKQIGQGGHYGTDLSDLAKVMNVTYRAVRMRITKWIKEEPDFFNLIYLGKSPPSITLDEFIEIKDRIQSNPLELKKHIMSDIRDKRELRNEDTLSTLFLPGEQSSGVSLHPFRQRSKRRYKHELYSKSKRHSSWSAKTSLSRNFST